MLIGRKLRRGPPAPNDAARLHPQMEAGRADRARDGAGAFPRSLPAVRAPDARPRTIPTGDHFTFEKGASKTGGGEGLADVWKKGFFAWEYKKKKRDLDKALEQLTRYAAALENPPLHVACDTHIFRIETRWTNEVPATYEFELDDLAEPIQSRDSARGLLRSRQAPARGRTRAKLTEGSRRQIPDDLGLACSIAIPIARRSRISSISSYSASSPTA